MEVNDLEVLQAEERDQPGDRDRNVNGVLNSERFTRHSKTSTRVLKQWFSSHLSWPYPDQSEKERLSNETGMTMKQVANWFVNARRRNGAKLHRRGVTGTVESLPGSGSGSLTQHNFDFDDGGCAILPTETLDITSVQLTGMTPFDRWRHTPPQQEPVSVQAVIDAAQQIRNFSATDTSGGPAMGCIAATDSLSSLDFPSSGAPCSSWGFSGSSSSASNNMSSVGSLGSLSSRDAPRRRRRRKSKLYGHRREQPTESQEKASRPYQCTFCTDTFKSRYDWTRHEASLHLALERWTCLLLGPRSRDPVGGVAHCTLCGKLEPDDDHLNLHRVASCTAKPIGLRTFMRKDHLRQHLRFAHGVKELTTWMDAWSSKEVNVRSRCGFCGDRFIRWPDRNEHLADHFRAGAQMKDWTGCRGLDPSVALLVENAMPPYLIGLEASDLDPFSASKAATKRITANVDEGAVYEQQIPRAPTSFESLTARLGDYVRIAKENNLDLTDEALRRQARLILYDEDDLWNHTPADNPQWLGMFKSGYGLSDTAVVCAPNNGASRQGNEASPFTVERLQHAAGSNQAVLQFHLGGQCGDGTVPDMMGPDLTVPWSWQTPECLAEFNQLYLSSDAPLACASGGGGLDVDPGVLESTYCPKEISYGLDAIGGGTDPASGSHNEDVLAVDEAILDTSL